MSSEGILNECVNVAPDVEQAIDFLKRLPAPYPTLSALYVDQRTKNKGRFETQSFVSVNGNVDWAQVRNWIELRSDANIYYALNSLRAGASYSKKASRTDVDSVIAFHVDVDARVGENQQDARERIVKVLKAYKPSPSVIVFSGGGAQALWFLDAPVSIGGDLAKTDEAKLYNLQIERDLGGDSCHNIDRILRLPGTINWPDAGKIKKGRSPILAEVVQLSPDKYPVDVFRKARLENRETVQAKAQVPSTVERIGNLDDPRLAGVSGRTKVLILCGHDPDEPGKHASRSEVLFAVCCELVRAEVPDEIIYAIITDRDFKISESVLDKKNVRAYALRQIENAKAVTTASDLAAMNGEHCVARIGGKTRVMSWEQSDIHPTHKDPVFQTFDDFKNFHSNRRHEYLDEDGKHKSVPMGHWWLSQSERRQYDGITFAPGNDEQVVRRKLNLWSSFAVQPGEGDCSLYLAHLRDNICLGNPEHSEYLLNWMARAVQQPDTVGEVVVVLKGREGVGKGVCVNWFGTLFGSHLLPVTHSKHLVGNFNAHLLNVCVLFGDEAFYAGDKAHESILKALATEATFMVEFKGLNAFLARNLVHLMLSSNEAWVIPAGPEARRYFVLSVGGAHMQDTDYFEAIRQQMENRGREALLHFLLARDISKFNVRHVPQTEALAEQKRLTRKGIDAFVEQICQEGRLPCMHDRYANVALTSGREKGEGLHAWLDVNFKELRGASPQRLNGPLKSDWGCERFDSGLLNGLRFPPLAELRADFVARHGPPPNGWERPNLADWEGGDGVPF